LDQHGLIGRHVDHSLDTEHGWRKGTQQLVQLLFVQRVIIGDFHAVDGIVLMVPVVSRRLLLRSVPGMDAFPVFQIELEHAGQVEVSASGGNHRGGGIDGPYATDDACKLVVVYLVPR